MDIQNWLDATTDAKVHPGSNQTLDPSCVDFFQHPEKPKPVVKAKQAPQRCKSDSSLLDPQPHSHSAPHKGKKHPTERTRGGSAHIEASCPSRSNSTESESSSNRYARKPRRKTRPERYEPKPVNERGNHVHHSKKDESKKTKGKSKRKKDKRSGSDAAQNFHAKNVSRDRLTLKPREKLGLFNKGKTSTAVRGRGLPDLVFSEMKFLQSGKDQLDPALQQPASKKKSKKDHIHTKEGEISAFFSSVRPALAENASNIQVQDARRGMITTTVDSRHDRDRPSKPIAIVPTIETPAKEHYSRFGSQGPQYASTGYVSWSESVRGPEVTSQNVEQALSFDEARQVQKYQSSCSIMVGETHGFKRPAPRSAKDAIRDGTEHFAVPAVLYPHPCHRASRSHSDPQHTSSPQALELVHRAASIHSNGAADSSSSMMPSASTHSRGKLQSCRSATDSWPKKNEKNNGKHARTTLKHQESVAGKEDNESDVEPQTSSDLGKVLQQCKHTIREQRQASAPRKRQTVIPEVSIESERRHRVTGLDVDGLRHVRFSGLDTASPAAPDYAGPSIYEQQAHHQTIPLRASEPTERLWGISHMAEQEYINDPTRFLYGDASCEEYFRQLSSYDLEDEAQGYSVKEPDVDGRMVQRTAPDHSIVAPGFWRPNRLY